MELKYAVQKYAWGKIGAASAVATLANSGCDDFSLNEAHCYAELWMGTHPNGPSSLKHSGETLAQFIRDHPDVLGRRVRQQFPDQQLPFLFKVLSVNKALSIQAHPDKNLAAKLHAARPDLYQDPNHKPEMVIALTDFEALCDFQPVCKIRQHLSCIAPLAECVGADWSSGQLQDWFSLLMKCDDQLVATQLLRWKEQLAAKTDRQFMDDLFLRLHDQYPGDVGCFVIYFLNYFRLQPGEALFLEANVPHAYLSGDAIECMAASDNVVRAGLTPKFIDVDTLCSMLNYQDCPQVGEERRKQVVPERQEHGGLLYSVPVPDFKVVSYLLEANTTVRLPERDGPSIVLVVKGPADGTSTTYTTMMAESCGPATYAQPGHGRLYAGVALFLAAGHVISVAVDPLHPIQLFQAFC